MSTDAGVTVVMLILVGRWLVFAVPVLSGLCAGLTFRGLRRDNVTAALIALGLTLVQTAAFYSWANSTPS